MTDSDPEPNTRAPGLLKRVDRLLRQVAGGAEDATTDTSSARELLWITAACTAIYGVAMGLFAATTRVEGGLPQLFASIVKVPALFALTIAVTFPSFYVVCTVGGYAGSAARLLRLLLFGVAVASATLASLAPVIAFFTMSTDSHGFMVLLNIAMFVLAVALGLRTIRARAAVVFDGEGTRGKGTSGKGMLRLWMATALIVGAQSSWILRPLVGRPEDRFMLFSPRDSNACAGFIEIFGQLLRGGE